MTPFLPVLTALMLVGQPDEAELPAEQAEQAEVEATDTHVTTSDNPDANGAGSGGNSGNNDVTPAQTFEATAYTAFCDSGCIGVTATGIDVSNTVKHDGRRVIAVDPAEIPLGSELRIETGGGRVIKGIAADTGGAIRGERIDVLMADKQDALDFGRQDVEVTVLK